MDAQSENLEYEPVMLPISQHELKTPRHTTSYLACGDVKAQPIIFIHGWPELSISWRHQLACFGELGFRAIAADMRGYGRSSVYKRHEDYSTEHIVADMIELLDGLNFEKAVWVGHDHGSPIAWALAAHHPNRSHGVANLCVPYIPTGLAPKNLVPLVNRSIYPEAEYPVGQWDYMYFYEENFEKARAGFEANIPNTVKALFRAGDPRGKGKPSRTATIRKTGGWFAGGGAPDVPMDTTVLSQDAFEKYVEGLTRNGFFGPDSWYMNSERNIEFAKRAANNGRIALPALFLHAEYDYVCETVTSRLCEPMRESCSNLTERIVKSGHWMAQEKPTDVNAALTRWLVEKLPEAWPP